MKSTTSSRSRSAARERHLCQFPFSDGRRCRMLRHFNHPKLCVFHARAEAQLLETEHLGTQLAQTISGDFMSATDINFAMGRLYEAVAQERIPIRNANALARIGRIMLGTVPLVKKEFPFSYTFDQWNNMLEGTSPLSPAHLSAEPLPPAPLLQEPGSAQQLPAPPLTAIAAPANPATAPSPNTDHAPSTRVETVTA